MVPRNDQRGGLLAYLVVPIYTTCMGARSRDQSNKCIGRYQTLSINNSLFATIHYELRNLFPHAIWGDIFKSSIIHVACQPLLDSFDNAHTFPSFPPCLPFFPFIRRKLCTVVVVVVVFGPSSPGKKATTKIKITTSSKLISSFSSSMGIIPRCLCLACLVTCRNHCM